MTETFDFGFAISHLKAGRRVARQGWNGKGMFLFLIKAQEWTYTNGKWDNYPLLPAIAMKTATGEVLMGWLASQTDMLSEDWVVVE